jgi:hypothetical protein
MPLAKAEVSLSIDKPYHDAGSSPYVAVQITNPNDAELVVAPLSGATVVVYCSSYDPETGENAPMGPLAFRDGMVVGDDSSAYTLEARSSMDRTFQINALPGTPGMYRLVAKYANSTAKGSFHSVSGIVEITVE